MSLSANVAQPSLNGKGGRQASPRLKNSPFGGMNQTHARIRGEPRARSAAEQKRSSQPNQKDESNKDGSTHFKALKMQIALSPVPYPRRNAIKHKIKELTSFDHLSLLPGVRHAIYHNALSGLTDVTPTPIQRLAIPAILSGSNKKVKKDEDDPPNFEQYLLAAETGTGKTLSYIVPIVDQIKRSEASEKEQAERESRENKLAAEEKAKERKENSVFEVEAPEVAQEEDPNSPRPKAIILVPTSELVTQVGKLVKQLSHIVKYRSALISSAYTPRRITNNLYVPGGIDILVATPHLLASIAKTNPYILSRVKHLVVDEADSLLDRSFAPTTCNIIDRASPSLSQLVFCSATIPRSMDSFLRNRFPDVRRLVTPNLHAIPRRVQLGVVDIDKEPYRGNRKLACADIIWSIGRAGGSYMDLPNVQGRVPEPKSLMVFVNERETAEEVAQFLVDKGLDAVALTRDSSDKRQSEILAEFTERKEQSLEELEAAKKTKQGNDDIPFVIDNNAGRGSNRLPNTKILVTTDLGSRGIDTIAVRTVILYDVPHSTVDFIHRLGRTGRMGKRGRGVVLVGRKDRKDVVKEVREAMFRGQALI